MTNQMGFNPEKSLYSNKMYFFLFLHENTWLLITTASVGDSYNSYPYYNMLFH